MLTAFKQVIQDYSPTLRTSFSCLLITHLAIQLPMITHLAIQFSHLATTQLTSVSLENAIREIHFEIGSIDTEHGP
ncbi:hypothetical protein CPB84DRAFT_1762251 [Gymnopilus junonius]|uniref:Uncharacterized protein n=1 Tax=Gymnopilus junonius TaxID=109634 RepID=A0A9P5P0I6_GYMJU|nr:hypothetical protein CPB84DRAFT_1762251 [Gymnopilus junonius]